MRQSFLTHLVWAIITISTYVASSQWARHWKGEPLSAHEKSSEQSRMAMLDSAEGVRITAKDHGLPEGGQIRFATMDPLEVDEIDALVRAAVNSRNPIERRRAFDQILQEVQSLSFSGEQAMNMRESMIQNGASGAQWRLLDYAWGASHPGMAIAYLDEVPSEYHDAFLDNMIPGLASENPQAAIDLFESLESDLQAKIRPRFLEGLIDNDIALATDYLYGSSDLENRDWRPMDTLAREIEKDRGLDSALEWAADLPEGSLRNNAWSAAYAVWAAQDPHAAVQSIVELPPSTDRDLAINGFTAAYAHADGERATVWAAEITSPGLREAALVRAGTHYFRQDQSAASAWFASSGLPQTILGKMSPKPQ
ncbi:MAG: hypothetical protein ACI9NC_004222 [Verrucomicrobiales bacterium]|jgi:hypothetical protein